MKTPKLTLGSFFIFSSYWKYRMPILHHSLRKADLALESGRRVSINRKVRKKKSCLSEASSFLLGLEIIIDRRRFRALTFCFFWVKPKEK